jgi:iron only hydrogenase large subunit-like protein
MKKKYEKVLDEILKEAFESPEAKLLIDVPEAFDAILKRCFPKDKFDESEKKIIKSMIKETLDIESGDNNSGERPLLTIIEEACEHCLEGVKSCEEACVVDAISVDDEGSHFIDESKCVDCGLCIAACKSGAIVERSEFLQIITYIRYRKKHPVYAILAPAFVGQFGPDITPEHVKAGLRRLGFTDVYEVALGADIVILKEAREFCDRMERNEEFMITSCCCPAFIKLVEKHRHKVAHLVSESVSPMIALGRLLKSREPSARVVFWGPCIAKKNEAKRPDLSDAVDCVITFKEGVRLLSAAGIDLGDEIGHLPVQDASHDGRIFAHTGGVTEAITRAIKRINPDLDVIPLKGNGLKQCNEILKKVEAGILEGNFMEGMGCPGGCVGGPGTVVHSEVVAQKVDEFAKRSDTYTAVDNSKAYNLIEGFGEDADLLSVKVKVLQK